MHFTLLPFAPTSRVDCLQGAFELDEGDIACRWELTGMLEGISWPARADAPSRRMSLWEHTCFEFFIGDAASEAYYEFNLSPSGDWNSFGFSGVRAGMAETGALVCTDCSVVEQGERRRAIAARVRFDPPGRADRYRVGISAVIEDKQGERHYFALGHDGGRPDFHRRSNHTLIIT